ncbi:hypothetical protein M3212_03770 [Alkalihalobacillus oceani]|uniref:CoA transferase subunit A n=1 Tax=Halalkalibacter oceani TaxID=1653776 RepID=UPI00203F7607|nr:CoA-transferase [Halalkalibacter oceani]MCM3759903.1 hypothetical protein [Halalkalibacter oceani]
MVNQVGVGVPVLDRYRKDENMERLSEKFIALDQAVSVIKPNSTITFSGFGHSMTPLAFIREMIRQQINNLHLIGIGEAWAVDMLAGANMLSHVWLSNFMFEGYGRCKNFSRKVEDGSIKVEDFSHYGQISRFAAGAANVPFLPIRSMLGTDLETETQNSDRTHKLKCPFTEEIVLAVAAVKPDYAVIHANRSDRNGNIQLLGNSTSVDEQVRAAKKVIVTVEEIVNEEEISKLSEVNTLPAFLVDYVVEVPYGAHPTGMYKYYSEDYEHIDYFMELSKTAEGFQQYLNEYVFNVKDHWEYLQKIGIENIQRLKADPYLGYQLPKK